MANDLISVDLEIKGLEDLERTFLDLSAQLNKQILRVATYAAAAKFRKAAKDNVKDYVPGPNNPIGKGHPPPGTLRKSIIVKQIREESGTFQQVYKTTVRKGGRSKYANTRANRRAGKIGQRYDYYVKGDAFYAHMVERGTSRMTPRPFMRPAFDENKQEATDAFFDRILKFFRDKGWIQ